MRFFTIPVMATAVFAGILSFAGSARAQPSGSYLQTCRDIEVRGKHRPNALLIAECQTRKGHWLESSLYYKQCRGDIYNDNGRLMCQGGQALRLTGPAPDLRDYNFDDRASSLRVEGKWFVCSGTNYRGECTRVTGSFNVGSKWNKRISSARPGE